MKTLKQIIIDLQKFAKENDALDLPCVTEDNDRWDYESYDGPFIIGDSESQNSYWDSDKCERVKVKSRIVVF